MLMLYAGMLWFVCSLPIITMGAASAALMEVMMKLSKNQEGYIGASFFAAFRANLRRGILVWLPFLIAQILWGVNAFYYGVLGGEAFRLQTVIFSLLLLCSMGAALYAFAVMAKFENTVKGTIVMAVALAVRNPGWTAALVVLQVLALFVCWFFVYLPLLFFMGIVGYVQAVMFDHIFQRMIDQGMITEQRQEGAYGEK